LFDARKKVLLRSFVPEAEILVPRSVEILGASCFESCRSIEIALFEGDCLLKTIGPRSFYASSIKTITVPNSVTTICDSAFASSSLTSITFDPSSRLNRIERCAFEFCEIGQIEIPEAVEFIEGSAFCCQILRKITLTGNKRFALQNGLLFDGSGTLLVRNFRNGGEVTVPKTVEVLGPGCFRGCCLQRIVCEEGSALRRIEAGAFECCKVDSIVFQTRVEFVDRTAFDGIECVGIFVQEDEDVFEGDDGAVIERVTVVQPLVAAGERLLVVEIEPDDFTARPPKNTSKCCILL
jgi:hypothetical protein